jgi:hypothetical protein
MKSSLKNYKITNGSLRYNALASDHFDRHINEEDKFSIPMNCQLQ